MAKFNNKGFITELEDNEIIVYGSNGQGNNAGGLARTAEDKGWTENGHISGLSKSGKAYAINTMDGKAKIVEGFANLFLFAEDNPDKVILLTPVGMGIAGYDKVDIETCMLRGFYSNFEDYVSDDIKYPSNIIKIGW